MHIPESQTLTVARRSVAEQKGGLQSMPGAEAEQEHPTEATITMWANAAGQEAFAEGESYIVTCLEPYTGRSSSSYAGR